MEGKPLRPLSEIKTGEKVKVATISAGHGLNSRLASMGILPNVELTVLSNAHPGPFVITVKDTRMVLGRGMADKIMVI
ncbi:MAG: FeoA family protein [Planctomycetota bacterium]|jgi:Fe2+ transport system protein FeoA